MISIAQVGARLGETRAGFDVAGADGWPGTDRDRACAWRGIVNHISVKTEGFRHARKLNSARFRSHFCLVALGQTTGAGFQGGGWTIVAVPPPRPIGSCQK